MIHLKPEDKTIEYRSCKRCGLREYIKTRVEGNKIIATKLEFTDDDAK